jgi:O-methyltransferase
MSTGDAAQRYLDLLKDCLTRAIFPGYSHPEPDLEVPAEVERWLEAASCTVVQTAPTDPEIRRLGLDWPADAETMIGRARLDNIEQCTVDVLRKNVPGDLIETGVWRGGASIFMRGVLAAYGDRRRCVWVADSFQGLPVVDAPPGESRPGDTLWKYSNLSVDLRQVQSNFARYGLLDEQVRFLSGWFSDTLPGAPIDRLALMRLDGDLYGSTMDALVALYPKLSVGGYVIVDDLALAQCREAVDDYRQRRGIDETIVMVDSTGGYWKKTWPAPP